MTETWTSRLDLQVFVFSLGSFSELQDSASTPKAWTLLCHAACAGLLWQSPLWLARLMQTARLMLYPPSRLVGPKPPLHSHCLQLHLMVICAPLLSLALTPVTQYSNLKRMLKVQGIGVPETRLPQTAARGMI